MNQFEEIFHSTVKLRGGRYSVQRDAFFSVEELKKEGQKLIDNIRTHRKHFPSVHIDFINDPTFNACAFKKEGHYFIGINIGVINVLENLFNYMMSHPKIMTDIGDVSKEEERDILKNILITDHNYLRLFMNYDLEVNHPVDDVRKEFSKTLLINAMEFLILHEYGHIVDGHVDYFSKAKGSSFIFEFSPHQNKGLSMQTLEMDADAFASTFTHRIIFGNYNQELDSSEEIKNIIKQKCYATYFMFRLFGESKYDLERLENYSHPTPGVRQHILFTTLHSLYIVEQKSQIISRSFLDEVIGDCLMNCEEALKKISEKTFNPIPVTIIFTEQGHKHFFKMMDNWKNVRPLIEQYSFATLAPITTWDVNKRKFIKRQLDNGFS